MFHFVLIFLLAHSTIAYHCDDRRSCANCLYQNWIDEHFATDAEERCAWIADLDRCFNIGNETLDDGYKNYTKTDLLTECETCSLQNVFGWNPFICSNAQTVGFALVLFSTVVMCGNVCYMFQVQREVMRQQKLATTDLSAHYGHDDALTRNAHLFMFTLPFAWTFLIFNFFELAVPSVIFYVLPCIPSILTMINVIKIHCGENKIRFTGKSPYRAFWGQTTDNAPDSFFSYFWETDQLSNLSKSFELLKDIRWRHKIQRELQEDEQVLWVQDHKLIEQYQYKWVFGLLLFIFFALGCAILVSTSIYYGPTSWFIIFFAIAAVVSSIPSLVSVLFYKTCYVLTNKRAMTLAPVLFTYRKQSFFVDEKSVRVTIELSPGVPNIEGKPSGSVHFITGGSQFSYQQSSAVETFQFDYIRDANTMLRTLQDQLHYVIEEEDVATFVNKTNWRKVLTIIGIALGVTAVAIGLITGIIGWWIGVISGASSLGAFIVGFWAISGYVIEHKMCHVRFVLQSPDNQTSKLQWIG